MDIKTSRIYELQLVENPLKNSSSLYLYFFMYNTHFIFKL